MTTRQDSKIPKQFSKTFFYFCRDESLFWDNQTYMNEIGLGK
jgi:hypothetical protein